jgi:hypothetical protein
MSGETIFCIDSGIKKNGTGFCLWNGMTLFRWGNVGYEELIKMIQFRDIPDFSFAVIEMFQPQSRIGYDSIENVIVMGKIINTIERNGRQCYRVTRRAVKAWHLGKFKPSAKDDSLIRQKLKEKYPDLKIPTNDATSAFAIATYITESNYEPKYYVFVQKKRVKRTPEETQHKKDLYIKNQIRKANNTLKKYATN